MKPLTSLIAIIGGAVSGCSLFQWATPGATLSDANVLAMLDTINIAEIDAAKLARQKASSAQVRTFASRMLNDHSTMIHDTSQLVQRIHVQPETPALASTTGDTHRKTMDEPANADWP